MKHEPAFPITEASYPYTGLSIRDYFAAAALTGMAASIHWSENIQKGQPVWLKQVAESAYEMADAMIAERTKP